MGGKLHSSVTRETSPRPGLAALEALYDAYHRQALGLAYRILQDRGDAEDIVQEVFLAAWRASDRYDPGRGSLRTWILAMVRNRAIDLLRARRRAPVSPLDERFDRPDETDVPDLVVTQLDGQRAWAALASLPPEQRQVIELAYFSGLSHSEIADRLATPVGTVKGRIRLALDRLRTMLRPAGDALVGS